MLPCVAPAAGGYCLQADSGSDFIFEVLQISFCHLVANFLSYVSSKSY
jgi:hypothetical protein